MDLVQDLRTKKVEFDKKVKVPVKKNDKLRYETN